VVEPEVDSERVNSSVPLTLTSPPLSSDDADPFSNISIKLRILRDRRDLREPVE
jgi:hypothetical protein